MTVQSNINNLNYLIGPTFTRVSRLLFCHLKELKKTMLKKDHRDSFSHHYVPNFEIKELNVLINWKIFFDFPVKNEEEAYEKSRNNDYTLRRVEIITTQLVIY